MKLKKRKLLVLPGDGIGKDVTESARPIFGDLAHIFSVEFGEIGWEFWKREGNPIPERTWEKIRAADVMLLGATTSKPQKEAMEECEISSPATYVSPIIQLRQRLDLYANVRPIVSMPGQGAEVLNMAVIRENTEGLYAGYDYHPVPQELLDFMKKSGKSHIRQLHSDASAIALRVLTERGLRRIMRFAFSWAQENGFEKVTWADKPNVLRESGQYAAEILEEVSAGYPSIQWEVKNVDAVAMWMVRRSESLEVIVGENQFGDILSDLGAGIMGGLGFAPSGNIGATKAYFEPVHGSAPSHAGKMDVNPTAYFLALAMLLRYCKAEEEAGRLERGIREVLMEGRCRTYDMGGNSSTLEMGEAIIRAFRKG